KQALMLGSAPKLRTPEWATDPAAVPTLGLKAISVLEGKSPREYLKLPNLDDGVVIRLNLPGEQERSLGQQTLPDGTVEDIKTKAYGVPRIPAWRVLKNDLSDTQRARLKGGLVFVGSTALGAFDHFPSPFSSQEPGVMVHAALADNLLNKRYLVEAPVLLPIFLVPVFILLAYLIVRLPPIWAGLSFSGLLVGVLGLHYALFLNLYYLTLAAPLVAYVAAFLVLIVHKTIEENRKAAEVRNMFGQYVAPEVVDILVKNPDKLSLGGEKRDMTMFFLDIAHSTTISEKMSPENLIQFLNTYLTALTDDILANNGVVDKYIGDCIMAFWNAPLEEKEHRRKACLAAVACVRTIARLNKEYVDPTIPETPAVRIGLNSGEVVVGNTGSARKLAYTVLGDEVNLASR
ncbi:MAG: adenylate/guanylate cyclase domain-containing protein, partial [Elusimicrobia bacterium]|nr:adenylate/guanylate cyclase domain-containing protein [Elusimicrobiota bacterium]